MMNRGTVLCVVLVAVLARAAAAAAGAAGVEDDKTGSQVWCVAKPHADASALANALNFACGSQGGADCAPIQPGGACYNPPTLLAHASYAFNSYYQRKGRNYWNCYFQNTALLVVTDPSYGSCTYPSS